MWTIYSERLFQTQGTWACATAGGGWTCFKTGCMPSWVKAWKVDGGGWGGGARSTSRGAVLWWILALLRFPGLENSCWIMVFVTATLGLRGIWLSEGWGWVGTALIRAVNSCPIWPRETLEVMVLLQNSMKHQHASFCPPFWASVLLAEQLILSHTCSIQSQLGVQEGDELLN